MNIVKENVDNLNAILRVKVEKNDYEERVANVLNDYRKKANIKGFRPGKAPVSLIKKMVGPKILFDEVNNMVYESMSKYLINEKIRILGEPMINEAEQKPIEWEEQDEFEFVFDLGLSPDVMVTLDKKDKIPMYKIMVDDAMIDEYVNEYSQRFGKFSSVDAIEKDEMIKADILELNENNEAKENGVFVENVSVYINSFKDEDSKNSFVGKQKDDQVILDLKKAVNNETELASMLNLKKEELPGLAASFKITIKDIMKYIPSEIDQELFDKVFGKDAVKSVEEFRSKLAEEISKNLISDSNYKFLIDVKEKILEKADIQLPVEFLKRWMLAVNEEKYTKEQLDEDFPKYENDMKWQVIKNSLISQNNIDVTEEEILAQAKEVARLQFLQYGLNNVGDEHLDNFAQSMLKREEDKKRLVEKIYEDKLVDFIKENITITEKEISKDDFIKMLDK